MEKDLTYINVPYDVDGPGKVIVRGAWPQWHRQIWLDALKAYTPQPVPFEPTFLPVTIMVDDGRGGQIIQNIYPGDQESFHGFYATTETAHEMARRYGTGVVVELPSPFAAGGPVSVEPKTAWGITLADGRNFNAGMLASYFVRDNEADTPGVADKLIRAVLA